MSIHFFDDSKVCFIFKLMHTDFQENLNVEYLPDVIFSCTYHVMENSLDNFIKLFAYINSYVKRLTKGNLRKKNVFYFMGISINDCILHWTFRVCFAVWLK